MYAKIFSKIFDSTIAENWQARVVFMDLLILADRDGVIDMTLAAISRRTNCPLEFVKQGIEILMLPDSDSRTDDDDGRRLELLDEHRDWGWRIINYRKYRDLKSSDELRAKNADRVRRYRERQKSCNEDATITPLQSVTSEYEYASENDPEGNLPIGFPKTIAQAIQMGRQSGCSAPDEYFSEVWEQARGRGGRDGADVPIRSWGSHVKMRWGKEKMKWESNRKESQKIKESKWVAAT